MGFPRDMSDVYAGYSAWVTHFLKMNGEVKNVEAYSYNCYCPWNYQTRYVATRYGHLIPTGDLQYREPDLKVAQTHLDQMYFVGLVDLYTESICLFRYYTAHSLPDGCACGRHESVPEHHIVHFVPPHSIDDLSPELLSDVGR